MPWVTAPHRCPRPFFVLGRRNGDVWECPDCRKRWRLYVDSRDCRWVSLEE